ncbi:MAG: radical SAM family heme chaperone HemW [Bacteroidota bacterium]
MAGIYLHIPFCRQACYYCDFHFSTNLQPIEAMVEAMCMELDLRASFLTDRHISTIYLGGGTPSLLAPEHIHRLLKAIAGQYEIEAGAEVTLEANPDDVNRDQLDAWRSAGINRLSLGIQTFDQDRLRQLNRAHNRTQALQSIQLALEEGFTNLTCDLIYAIPPSAMSLWMKDVEQMIDFGVGHLSLYGLTIEEQTVFGRRKAKGQFQEVSENDNADQYQYAIERLADAGYRHYEVSNFCLPGRVSRHNSSYWRQVQYLGIGPGAHSYNGKSRTFAVRSNSKYIQHITKGRLPIEEELLAIIDKVNEYTMTRVRTTFGLDIRLLDDLSGGRYTQDNQAILDWMVSQQWMRRSPNGMYVTTDAGMFHADEIAVKLFLAD